MSVIPLLGDQGRKSKLLRPGLHNGTELRRKKRRERSGEGRKRKAQISLFLLDAKDG